MDKQVFDLFNKLDSKLDAQNEKLGEYNGTLIRLTKTVEHHVKRSDGADEDRAQMKIQMNHIGDEVEGLKDHVDKAEPIIESITTFTKFFKLVFSLKGLKWLIAICGVVSSFFGMKYAAREYKVFKNSTPEYKAATKNK